MTVSMQRRRHVPPVAEALGYIGGILGAVGLVLLIGRTWADASTTARVAISATAALVSITGGALVRVTEPAFDRLRSTLWLAGTVAVGVLAAVIATDVVDISGNRQRVVAVSLAIAITDLALWQGRRRPIQQACALVASIVAIGVATGIAAELTAAGWMVWALGAVLVVLGLREVLRIATVTLAIGAGSTVTGSFLVAHGDQNAMLLVVVVNTGLLATLAVVPGLTRHLVDRIVLVVVAAFAALNGTPPAVAFFARDAGVVTGVVMWLVGTALVVMATRRVLWGSPVIEAFGGVIVLAGAAVTGVQSVAVATLFGTATAIGFVGLGLLPGRVLMSLLGSAGLLAFVPWSIAHWFPGQNRAPLLITVSGVLLVGIAVLLARQGHRFRHELRAPSELPSEAGAVDVDAEQGLAEGLVQTR